MDGWEEWGGELILGLPKVASILVFYHPQNPRETETTSPEPEAVESFRKE
jgi:hypothetical protein